MTATLKFLLISILIKVSLCKSGHVDVKFDLKLKHVPHDCRKILLSYTSNDTCKLPYAISVLESYGDFDLQAVMLQDGHANHVTKERRHFKEDTVVPIPSSIQTNGDGHVYVGVKFYGLTKFVQDYFVMDITKLIKNPTLKTVTAVDSSDLSFMAVVKYGKVKPDRYNSDTVQSCGCVGWTCSCCSHMDIPKISLNHTGCVNITYLPDQYGISFTLSLDGTVVYNDTVSARNPPPVCFNVPYLKEYASLCVRFHDLDITEHKFYGCVRVEAELYHVRVGEKELGCFHLGPKKQHVNALFVI
jgi:hypothetical protein